MNSLPSVPNEDYLERTLELLTEKGYARVSDIAERLGVRPASVTKMLQRLEVQGYLVREPYRGFTLTPKGKNIAVRIRKRHEILKSFLQLLQIPEQVMEKDIDGLEHHLSNETVAALEKFLKQLGTSADNGGNTV